MINNTVKMKNQEVIVAQKLRKNRNLTRLKNSVSFVWRIIACLSSIAAVVFPELSNFSTQHYFPVVIFDV